MAFSALSMRIILLLHAVNLGKNFPLHRLRRSYSSIPCQGEPPFAWDTIYYCDDQSTGRYKKCSPCTIENLLSPMILHPEECSAAPCPYRCPEGLYVDSPAPRDSCAVDTTVQPTTAGMTTLADSTLATTTPKPEGGEATSAGSTWSNAAPPATAFTHNREDGSVPWTFVVLGILICAILLSCVAAIVACFVHKKRVSRRRLRTARHKSSCPLMANGDHLELSVTPASTPDTPDADMTVAPCVNAIEVSSNVQIASISLECGCGRVDGKVIKDLLPRTCYKVVMETASHGNLSKVTCTTGDVDYTLCELTLLELERMMENHNSADTWVYSLRENFACIKDEDVLSSLATALRVQSLYDATGRNFLREILTIDDRHRLGEEDSFRVYVILETLRASLFPKDMVPKHVTSIAKCLHSLHPQCVPCGHVVHQLVGLKPLVMTTQV